MNKDRLWDIYNKAYFSDVPAYSDFLNLEEQSIYESFKKQFNPMKSFLFGGYTFSERKILCIHPPDVDIDIKDIPYELVKIQPLNAKYSDKLTHRDYLGSLMNLGIERHLLGDILIFEEYCFLLCKKHIAKYICEELTIVKHTMVNLKISDKNTILDYIPEMLNMKFSVSSIRLDNIISGGFSLSRRTAISLIDSGKAFVNGREVLKSHYQLKPKDIISLRGYGKFIYDDIINTTKKNKLLVNIQKFI